MQISDISHKQKRYLYWNSLLEKLNQSALKDRLSEILKRYLNLLTNCWVANSVSQADERSIQSYERQLTQMAEEIRLRTCIPD